MDSPVHNEISLVQSLTLNISRFAECTFCISHPVKTRCKLNEHYREIMRCFEAGYISNKDYAHTISPLEMSASGQTARLSRTWPEGSGRHKEPGRRRLTRHIVYQMNKHSLDSSTSTILLTPEETNTITGLFRPLQLLVLFCFLNDLESLF